MDYELHDRATQLFDSSVTVSAICQASAGWRQHWLLIGPRG